MAEPKFKYLDDLVNGVDFCRLEDDDFCSKIESLVRGLPFETHDRTRVERTLVGLTKHLSKNNFPSDKSNTYRVVNKILSQVKQAVSRASRSEVESERYTEADLVPQLRDIFYTCLQHGPTLGHFAVLGTIVRSFNFNTIYIKTVRGDEARKLFEALKCSYNTDVPAKEHKSYKSKFSSFYDSMFKWINIKSGEALEHYSPWVADLSLHYIKQILGTADTDVVRIFRNIIWHIFSEYKSGFRENPYFLYCHLDDAHTRVLVDHLDQFKAYVTDGTFCQRESLGRVVAEWMDMLVQPLKQGIPYAENNAQLYVDLLVAMQSSTVAYVKDCVPSFARIVKSMDSALIQKCAVPCTELAMKIRNSPSSQSSALRQTADSVMANTFRSGVVMDGAFEVLVALINTGRDDNLSYVQHTLRGSKVDWNKHKDQFKPLLTAVLETSTKPGARTCNSLDGIAEWIADTAERYNAINLINADLVRALVLSLAHPNENQTLHHAIRTACRKIDWNMNLPQLHEAFSAYVQSIKKFGQCLTLEKYLNFSWVVRSFVMKMRTDLSNTDRAGEFVEDFEAFLSTALTALERARRDENRDLVKIFIDHIFNMSYFIDQLSDKPEHIRPLVPIMLKISEAGIDGLSESWSVMFSGAGRKQPAVLADYVPRLIAIAMKIAPNMGAQYAAVFHDMYPHGEEHFHSELGNLLSFSKSKSGTSWPLMTLQIASKIAERHPEVLTNGHISLLVAMVELSNVSQIVYGILEKAALHRADIVSPILDSVVVKAIKDYPEAQPSVIRTISLVGRIRQTEAASRIEQLLTLVPKMKETCHVLMVTKIQELGSLFPTILSPLKERIVATKAQFPVTSDICNGIIDIIEGRSLAGLSEDVEEQRDDLEVVKTDVSDTKQKVDHVSTKVDEQGSDLKHVQEDVTMVEERLDVVEETVDDTVQKVEEVDRKTMTNAPAWSRDVSLLLNPESDRDWRLLGQRLGYSKNDIRGWATQHDPCMAVLSEWYATHKTREATHGVLKALEEMNREDAAEIVRKAKEEGDAVLEEEEEDSGPLPPVFLSYQWGHQPHIKLLKRHLEKAGFRCWMDTGQMGGGDKLFAKIDAGMRAATVIICCVSEKYAKSDNCTREVNLAVNLGKPIIPLLMEKMKWPPEGAMGPIFGEYLFIRFNQRSGEETGDERFWPAAKFEELIMQLRYSIVPDETMITEEYREWWNPKDEQIAIPRTSENRAISEVPTEQIQEQPKSPEPEVFLSYQWGKQAQIKALFTRLTSLGYSCWMDIHQMGGGDSLYEKIDKGVRNAKVVVCCVTPKYALSANCRREVSLADALKKPIIPLLLDKMTWPPEGPMSMVMTQLVYIGFSGDPKNQFKWTGSKMDELIQKMNQHVPLCFKPHKATIKKSTKSSSSHQENETKTRKSESAASKSKSCTLL